MPVSASVEVVGLKETINALRKIDPQLQKDFKADATAIAQPAIQAAKLAYSQFPLSGMAYRWADRGRKIFPFTISGAQAGVKIRFDTRRNAVGVILIEQKNAATAVFEGAGRKDTNRLGTSLDSVSTERGFAMAMPGRTRLIGPAVYKARRALRAKWKRWCSKPLTKYRKTLTNGTVNPHYQRVPRRWRR
jgi:hypothetical protein